MERLTRKSEKGDYTTMGFIYMDKDTDCYKAVQRLADYEDIGTVDDFKDHKAGAENLNLKGDEILLKPFEVKGFVYDSEEYKQLKAENESIKKQLENSVQVPCKVGDTVYYIRAAISKNPHEPKIEVGTVLKIIVTKNGLRLALSMNSVYENSTNSIGKAIFFDEQEANNALENVKQRMK